MHVEPDLALLLLVVVLVLVLVRFGRLLRVVRLLAVRVRLLLFVLALPVVRQKRDCCTVCLVELIYLPLPRYLHQYQCLKSPLFFRL